MLSWGLGDRGLPNVSVISFSLFTIERINNEKAYGKKYVYCMEQNDKILKKQNGNTKEAKSVYSV